MLELNVYAHELLEMNGWYLVENGEGLNGRIRESECGFRIVYE